MCNRKPYDAIQPHAYANVNTPLPPKKKKNYIKRKSHASLFTGQKYHFLILLPPSPKQALTQAHELTYNNKCKIDKNKWDPRQKMHSFLETCKMSNSKKKKSFTKMTPEKDSNI